MTDTAAPDDCLADLSAEELRAELATATAKLEAIRALVSEHSHGRSLDNDWPDDWARDIRGVLDETTCDECGHSGQQDWLGTDHAHSCSRFERRAKTRFRV